MEEESGLIGSVFREYGMAGGYEREWRWHDWQGIRILEINQFPLSVSDHLTLDLISDCVFRHIAVDFCMASVSGEQRAFIILHADGSARKPLQELLDDSSDYLQSVLQNKGFHVREQDGECKDLLYSLMPCESESMALFFPPEHNASYYAPAMIESPIDFGAVAQALSRSQRAVFTISLIPADLSGEEKRLISENCIFFEGIVRSKYGREEAECLNRFKRLWSIAESQSVLVEISMHGDYPSIHEVSSAMHRQRLEAYRIDTDKMVLFDDPMMVTHQIAAELIEKGHTLSDGLPPEMRRLSHIDSIEHAGRVCCFFEQTEKLEGFKVSSLPVEKIPGEMLSGSGIEIGVSEETGQVLSVPAEWFPLHSMIVGMPGSGKTTFAMGLLWKLSEMGYPFLIIEPTKTEYRSLIDRIPNLRILTAGRSNVSPISLNPFLPPEGVTLEQFKPSLISVFKAAFSMTSPLDVILPEVVNECYARYGWRDNSTRDSDGAVIFGLREFIAVFRESIRNSNYDSESKANLESGGVYRLQALMTANRILFDTDQAVSYEELLETPTLIELDAIDNQEQKALIMSVLLSNLSLAIRRKQIQDGRFKNLILIDEAHLILGQHLGAANEHSAKSSESAVQMLQNLIVTIRAYGTGFIFADQSARKLTEEIVNNCNLKFVFHLDNAEEKHILSDSMGMVSSMLQRIRQFKPGEAYVGCSALEHALCIRTTNYKETLGLRSKVPDEEVREKMSEYRRALIPFSACRELGLCKNGCDIACRTEADFIVKNIQSENRQLLGDDEKKKNLESGAKEIAARYVSRFSKDYCDRERLVGCTSIQLIRMIRSQ